MTDADTQRHALIDHLVTCHGADDYVNSCWPGLSSLVREHIAAHDRMPSGRGVKYEAPDHGHDGTDVWQGMPLRGAA